MHVFISFLTELQKEAADMFGMEAAIFVPTVTMGNLISGTFGARCPELLIKLVYFKPCFIVTW